MTRTTRCEVCKKGMQLPGATGLLLAASSNEPTRCERNLPVSWGRIVLRGRHQARGEKKGEKIDVGAGAGGGLKCGLGETKAGTTTLHCPARLFEDALE